MCGIVGVFRPSQSPWPLTEMEKLTRLLGHRGPDGSGTEAHHSASFGHTRLAILGLDEPLSRQPVKASDCLLSFNGEIYNFKKLQKNLRENGIACGEKSDTETLFQCLCHWGVEETLRRIDGMFAFAFYDGRSRSLYLARDRLGEKPLYWSHGRNGLCFASEIKAILASGLVSSEPNLARLDDFFHTGVVNGSQTLFRDVRELTPGSYLSLNEEQSEPVIKNYWSLENAGSKGKPKSWEKWGEEFIGRFDEAISSRRISDVPTGILLSGGIDSNSIAQRVMEKSTLPPPFFFAESSDPECNERADVEIFLDHQRERMDSEAINLFTATPDLGSFLADHARLTWHFDEPMVFTNSISLSAITRKAQRENIKVLLSGEGSDEIFYGYDRFTRTAEELKGAVTQDDIYRHVYIGGGLHNIDVVDSLCAGKADGERQSEPWQWLEKYGRDMSLPDLQLRFSQKFRLLTLLHRQDRVGMSHGVECRIPFLAPDFVEWVNQLPIETKCGPEGNATKYLLRYAMRNKLPARILNKPKDGFPSGIETWVRDGHFRHLVEKLIGDSDGFLNSYLDGHLARNIVKQYFSGQGRYEVLIWRFINLEIWHRLFRWGQSSSGGGESYPTLVEELSEFNPAPH